MKTLFIEERERIESILSRCEICYVGMAGENRIPYVIPMNFGYEDGVLYLHSGPTGRCIDLLQKQKRICVCFSTDHELVFQHPQVACSYRMKAKSIVCYGNVGFIDDVEQKRRALDLIMHHYSGRDFQYSLPALKNVLVWKIPIDELSAKEYGAPHY